MRGLYAIIDITSLVHAGLDPVRFATALLEAEPAAIQLRDKRGRAHDTLTLLRELQALCKQRGVPLYANDRPDLAALAGCHGVHLGQRDLPPERARELFERLGIERTRIGVSVHDAGELDCAMSSNADYVALGPVFGTTSKDHPEPALGLDGLDDLVARLDGRRPAVAIGGITLRSAGAIAHRCGAGAVIAALLPDRNEREPYHAVSERARMLHERLREGTP